MKRIISIFTIIVSMCFFSVQTYAEEVDSNHDWEVEHSEEVENIEFEEDPEISDNANSWRYKDGQPIDNSENVLKQRSVPSHPNATRKGIDVSEWQGDIDWAKVKASGIDFAILRCGFGMDQTNQDDAYFLKNAKECERLGIPYGVYIYSYATNTSRASSEADHVLRLLKGRDLAYPVYFDMEDSSTLKYKSSFGAIATTFCNKISAAGYPVGVYANLNWWNNYLTDSCFDKWHKWVAQYYNTCQYEGTYAMWQYTSKGSVNGIKGSVDMNYLIGYPKDHGYSTYERYYGTNRYQTSIAVAYSLKSELNVNKFDNIVLASGEDYADALSGSYLAKNKNAPIILIDESPGNREVVASYIKNNLSSKGTVYILGEEGVIDKSFEQSLDANVKRLGGIDRYETNNLILKEIGIANEDILICSGEDFADGLSASAVGKPVMLVSSAGLSSTQESYLNNIEVKNVYLIGGSGVISDEIGKTLNKYDENGKCERVSGTNRYKTSIAVANEFFSDTNGTAVFVSACDFADGLSGGPLAISLNAPLILIDKNSYEDAAKYVADNAVTKAVVLGGTGVVSDAVMQKIL